MIRAQELAHALDRPAPTPEQTIVIEASMEPTLVIAGAGSGKTETIASRVVYLVANRQVDPEQVLGLTFSRKAASELAERIHRRLALLASSGAVDDELAARIVDAQPAISTYHSFAGRLIGEFGALAGIEPPTRVLSETAAWQLAREVVGSWDGDLETDNGPDRVTENVLALSGALSDHLLDVAALDKELAAIAAALAGAPPSRRQSGPLHSKLIPICRALHDRREFLPLVQAYADAKRRARTVDFADQMQLAAALVRSAPRVGETLRSRHRVVLLDEYQDTGHAQRVILGSVFGTLAAHDDDQADARVAWRGHCVTAVGDPVQSIYSWRGASASNLPRFTTDFPQRDGTRAVTRPLLVSFRNARQILAVANQVSAPVRSSPVSVGELRPRADADSGHVSAALFETVDNENLWVADRLANLWAERDRPRTMAVLVRRRSAMAPLAAALRARGIPVEMVGVGGLVHEPEVADVLAILRILVDHESGPAAMRILTGSRWRLGIVDIAALADRARSLRPTAAPSGPGGPGPSSGALARIRAALAETMQGEDVDEAGLLDALADPGTASRYSAEGFDRITRLDRELTMLRARLSSPLPDLILDIQRVTDLETEVLLTSSGRSHLDAFGAIVSDLAAQGSGPIELLDYVAAAAEREDGLTPGTVAADPSRVQILTVHAAKGLEWDVVAVPQLCAGVFPSDDRVSTWLTDAHELPPSLRGDGADLPVFALPADGDQGQLAQAIDVHKAAWRQRQAVEERRLFYVAVTRAKDELMLSAHQWAGEKKKPRQPGALLTELTGLSATAGATLPGATLPGATVRSDTTLPLDTTRQPDAVVTDVPQWAPPPPDGAGNPLVDDPVTAEWPLDPLGDRRAAIQAGARLVEQARAQVAGADPDGADPDGADPHSADPHSADPHSADPDGWYRDITLLLAERAAHARARATVEVELPRSISVSSLVGLAADPAHLAQRLHRPVPMPPAPQARRGTRFHAWLQQRYSVQTLLDLEQLPGAHDRDAAGDERLPQLIHAFEHSQWASRTPIAVEVPFITQIGGQTIRGRMDAVFREPDGAALVVDWKTGAPPTGGQARAAAIQLTAYRIAWARLHDVPLDTVRAAFYYVAANQTVVPEHLLDARELEQLVTRSTVDAVDRALR